MTMARRRSNAATATRAQRWGEISMNAGTLCPLQLPMFCSNSVATGPGQTCVSYMGVNNYTKKWERLTTYGGKLSADATQATAREIMAENLPEIEEAGYLPVLLVHDEVVTETPDTRDYSVGELNYLLARQPHWAEGLPLAAGGFEAYRYRKDG